MKTEKIGRMWLTKSNTVPSKCRINSIFRHAYQTQNQVPANLDGAQSYLVYFIKTVLEMITTSPHGTAWAEEGAGLEDGTKSQLEAAGGQGGSLDLLGAWAAKGIWTYPKALLCWALPERLGRVSLKDPRQINTVWYYLYVEAKIWPKWTHRQNRNRLRRGEQTWGCWGEGEFEVGRCKLFHFEWISNEVLHHVLSSLLGQNVRQEYKQKNVYICMTEPLCCAAEIGATL